MKSKFYITTSIMYTNSLPHVGFALELIQADVIARYYRLMGDDVWLLTGTDEHGSTVAKAAAKKGIEPQNFVDDISGKVKDLAKKLGITNDDFIRTSDKNRHWPAAVKFWNKLMEAGDLYKKKYKGLYCVGHESFIKKNELVDGRCPLHKTLPEELEEENWFFKLTNYKKEIKKKIEDGELKIVPASKIPEVMNLLDDAEDISVSRPASALTWGIPVPNDPEQRIWVWLDALPNYLSAIGYTDETEQFKKLWPADIHLVGKDIFRFHALLWPAFLLSAGLSLPKSIYIHGFITVEGEKMSKTIGNIIDPFALIEKYSSASSPQAGVDIIRYFLLREIPSTGDGDFSYKKLEERYNGDLANGLGNLVQRVITLIDARLDGGLIYKKELLEKEIESKVAELFKKYRGSIENFQLHEALANIWELVGFGDRYVDDKKPWVVPILSPSELQNRGSSISEQNQNDFVEIGTINFLRTMTNLLYVIYNVSWMLLPFMPETADKIFETIGADKETAIDGYAFKIKKSPSLFPRLK